MRRRLKLTLAFACCALLVNVSASPPSVPPRLTSVSHQAHWDSLKTKIEERARFFASLAPATTTRRVWDGNARAMQEQEYAGDLWHALSMCESGGDWSYNGPSGFDGGLQFSPSTWTAYGGGEFAEYAWGASPSQQITVAERVLARQGWNAWPACSRKLGLR